MSQPPAPGKEPSQPRGRAKACTGCRQVKLACDARTIGMPCTRCQKTNNHCRMDATFRRVPARRQLEELHNRVEYLQTTWFGQDPRTETNSSLPEMMRRVNRPPIRQFPLPGDSHASVSAGSEPMEYATSATPLRQFYAIPPEKENEEGNWTLGKTTFNAQQIRELFTHFDKTHYKHGPFLEPCTSLHEYYKNSEILFWTVTMIGCYLFNEYQDLYWELMPLHRDMLARKMMGSKTDLNAVHAMLCMATWTYPVSKDYDDLTWMLCGAAIHTAMSLGLHTRGSSDEFSSPDDQRNSGTQHTRNITWLSLFITSTGISSWLGMPPPLGAHSHLETIQTLCQDSNIPKYYRARAEIHLRTTKLLGSITSRSNFQDRFHTIQTFENELDRVRDDYADVFDDDLEIEWHGARIYLYGIIFVHTGPTSDNNPVEAKQILVKGLATAASCLEIVDRMELPETAPGENRCGVRDDVYQLGFYPKHFFRIGAFATYYLLWFLQVAPNANERDRETAKTYITITYKLLISFTHSKEHSRAGEAIKILAHMPAAVTRLSQVEARLGANFVYSLDHSQAVAAEPGFTSTLGIDRVGTNDAFPEVDRHVSASNSSTTTALPTAHTSPHSSQDHQGPAVTSQYHQQPYRDDRFQGSTPTSIHSEPLPNLNEVNYPVQMLSPTHAGIAATMAEQQQMAMAAAVNSMSPEIRQMFTMVSPMVQAQLMVMSPQQQMDFARLAQETTPEMMDPEMVNIMHAQFNYPFAEADWDNSILNDIPPHLEATGLMGNIQLSSQQAPQHGLSHQQQNPHQQTHGQHQRYQ